MRALAATLVVALAFPGSVAARDPQVIAVASLARAPTVDGNLSEWGAGGWLKIPIAPAVKREERASLGLDPQDRNNVGAITVELKAGVATGRLFFALRWPDESPDVEYRLWERRGGQYVEGSQRDDALALRFPMEGELDRSMLSGKSYVADVWLWSAGRSQPSRLAEDMVHRISTKPIENAAEYEVKGIGTVYIRKTRDAGAPLYRNVRPTVNARGEQLPSIEANPRPSGSVADVAARGEWKKGTWQLELSRRMDTGNADDAAFRPGSRIAFQIAVFDRSGDENKSVSEVLLLDLSALR